MNITEKIYNYYPKVFKKLEDYLHEKKSLSISTHHKGPGRPKFAVFRNNFGLEFSMLYGLLEDFFEENEIIIETKAIFKNELPYIIKCFIGYIFVTNTESVYCTYNWFVKNEAKQQAILKACELLEDK